jgi:uncharacterized OB-fold protein
MAAYEKPLPTLTTLNRPYFEGAKKGELRVQRCESCGHLWFPPSTHCPSCLSREYQWFPVSGRGTVWSWVVFHQKYFKAFANELPYNCAMVKLEEGPMMMSNIVGVSNDEIRCDMPVKVVFEDATDEIAVAKFQPA